MAWVQVLNQIVFELPPEHPLADTRPLREFLGHTPPQVSFPFLAFSSLDLKGLGKSLKAQSVIMITCDIGGRVE
jgi:hypothetical protein